MLHDARPGEAPASTASAAQDPEHQSPREPSAQAAGTGALHTPGPTFTWDGVRSPHSGWGSCTPGCGPQGPPTSNHHTPFLLLCRKTPTHKDPVLFLEHSSGGRDPSGSFPPSLRGSPLPQSPPLSPGFTAAPCTAGDGWTSRASGGSCPSSRPSGQSSTPASPQKSCPTPRAVLPTRVQHRAEVQLWDERSPTLQAETLLLPLTEASPLLGSLAPLPAHLPALPQEVLRKHRLPTAVRRHKSSSQNITSATTLSW